MRGKKNKFSFGIFQDGLTVKVAELVLIDGQIKILRLSKTELSAPLYPKVTNGMQDEFAALEDLKEEKEPNLEEIKEIHDLEDLEIPGTISEEDMGFDQETVVEAPEMVSDFHQEDIPSGLNDLQILMQTFPLEKGKIAINANDEQISYYQFDSAFATSKLDRKLKEELLSKEELKSKNYSMDYIINPNGTGLAFVHRGRFELLDAVQDINTVISREKYIFDHIDTNEIALMNLVRNCYDFPPEDFVTLLYIGVDYVVGIVMKDNSHVKTFPIIITETDPEKKRMAIYSKIILEQDISNTPITQHVILAGENVSDQDVDFFQKKGFYWDPPKRLELKGLDLVEGESDKLTVERIAQYAIPISLAWKVLDIKQPNFFPSNLLPTKIIESQKYFKIAWHGFLVLAAIFYFALSGTIRNLELHQEIVNIRSTISQTQTELRHVRRMVQQVKEVKTKIEILKNNMEKVKNIIGNKNQWYYIIKNFSASLYNNKITWINELNSQEDRFEIFGWTTHRRNIIDLAKLFPNSTIKQINSNFIEDIPLWDFEISFSYPDPEKVMLEKELKQQTRFLKSEEYKPVVISQPEVAKDDTTKIYNNIITIYFAGNIKEAHERFKDFIENYPEHTRVYNALYFVGECQYHLGFIDEAIISFEQVLEQEGSKSPDALMMLGNSYELLEDEQNATYYWDRLVKKYPLNNLSKLARYKLEQIQG